MLALCLYTCLVRPKRFVCTLAAKAENSHTLVQMYVDEYVAWSASHSGACPASLEDIQVPDRLNSRDLFGRPLIVHCGDTAPPGGVPFGVTSAGRDGIIGTRDDINSWSEPDMVMYWAPPKGVFGLLRRPIWTWPPPPQTALR